MIPITLKYCVTEIINVEKSQNINDVNFICVEHTENGKRMFTAFIGSGENNNDKISIKISPHGGIFESKLMAGSALPNAESLLKKDAKNKVISKQTFIDEYNRQKNRLIINL